MAFTPKNIDKVRTGALLNNTRPPVVYPMVHDDAMQLCNEGWNLYVVAQARGRCYYYEKTITIPAWAFQRGYSFLTWYVAHELSHAFTFKKHGNVSPHGKEFMKTLKMICPADCLHFETSYKPKNAIAAGISQCRYVNTGTIPADF